MALSFFNASITLLFTHFLFEVGRKRKKSRVDEDGRSDQSMEKKRVKGRGIKTKGEREDRNTEKGRWGGKRRND